MEKTKGSKTRPKKTMNNLRKKEQGFVLDGIAVSTNSASYQHCNPKQYSGIPPYIAMKDPHCKQHFKKATMFPPNAKNYQTRFGTSASGWSSDYFQNHGPCQRQLKSRNEAGTGYSSEQNDGHVAFMAKNIRKVVSANGRYGYRRNTPSLRNETSKFGEVTPFPLH
ncbi:uncharacterized protein C17orf98-like isoform X2 [Protopterus annectens]|nr:uncharacterized protein C17orf98-like isoform X2 [Protopterus annectens]